MVSTEIQNFLTYLKSAHTSQQFLKKCYKQMALEDAEKKSYQNSYRFLYYLEHGQTFFHTGEEANIVTKPILLFYGMVHLLKACLLTQRPDYPESTSVLAHGVSTRKRKKQNYSFLEDEVKLQHKGLFPYFSSHLYQMKQLPYEKVSMAQLFATIPELNELFRLHRKSGTLLPVGEADSKELLISEQILDHYHMTEKSFIAYIKNAVPTVLSSSKQKNDLHFHLEVPLEPSSFGPFFYHLNKNKFYLPRNKTYISHNHEVMNHYLILYNLSMISRYETEWWGELVHTLPTEDYPFIQHFLSIVPSKVPYLLGYFLYKKWEN